MQWSGSKRQSNNGKNCSMNKATDFSTEKEEVFSEIAQALLTGSQRHTDAAIRQSLATENFTREVAQWRQLLEEHDRRCKSCPEILARVETILKEEASSKELSFKWWEGVWTKIIVALLGGGVITLIVQYLLKLAEAKNNLPS